MSKLEESAFGLSQEEMEQIRYLEILKRRKEDKKDKKKSKKFSLLLSTEAQLAMQLAFEDTRALREETDETHRQLSASSSGGLNNIKETFSTESGILMDETASVSSCGTACASNSGRSRTRKLSRERSFTELYDRHNSARMRRDITDENYSELNELKRPLGGGKLESAMEIVEVVERGKDPVESSLDDDAIEELARINSVDKCEVWMAATEVHHLPAITEVEFEYRELES